MPYTLIYEEPLSYVVREINRASYMADADGVRNYKVEQLPASYPTFGNTDLNAPALHVRYADGSRLTDLRYRSHRFTEGKSAIPGLPSSRDDDGSATTLDIVLHDAVHEIDCVLSITAFPYHDVFTQHVRIENHGAEPVVIDRVMSAHLPIGRADLDLVTLTGAWGREAYSSREPLRQGLQGIRSARGASGHGQVPFLALADRETTQDSGRAYGFTLVYSGNFAATCEVDMHDNTRVDVGINPFDFSWQLGPGEQFDAPEAICSVSQRGFNELSQRLHAFMTDCLVPARFARAERPVVINSWESAYFAFDGRSLLALAQRAARVGVELFVLDDGWFGARRDDVSTAMGDWFPNEPKLGGSLDELIGKIRDLGLDFGLWFEPEMVAEDSELFRTHPDWRMEVPGHEPQRIRSEYALDLTRREVQDHLIATLGGLLDRYEISYVKWDMNRNLTDLYSSSLPPDRQDEVAHRYILGVYRVLEALTRRHPDVLFESCAGGGGRFDAGMLAYTNQTWASDDTDAIARLRTQEGFSYVFPPSSMSCHVSAAPNHQLGRTTPMSTRLAVAQQGVLGYELNLTELDDAALAQVKDDIASYKARRAVLQFGVHSRLTTTEPGNEFAWQKTLDDRVIVTFVRVLARPNTVPKRLLLVDLDPTGNYRDEHGQVHTGSELMNIGLPLCSLSGDFASIVWELTKE
ncbi:alpha-galactosidase [Propionibacterium cyclohexanicum]|uniref:Alpha-galactosidase n=1 Tax=Propionibacterium cyclohexanicum TaxID=64702 RepID=A0A1H9U0Y4_9ACTN|nr:alpha-galactosidase [Propionibacterium cyclohexanicum]SES03125.1 alpha-galactosidase [Propionibacterium cyclohexanicum]